MQNAEHQFRV